MEEWINVADALPNDGEEVLVCVKTEFENAYITLDLMYTNIRDERNWMQHMRKGITHWMHKPDLPEEYA